MNPFVPVHVLQAPRSSLILRTLIAMVPFPAHLPLLPDPRSPSLMSLETQVPLLSAKSSASPCSFLNVLALPCCDWSLGLPWGHRWPCSPSSAGSFLPSLLIPLGVEVKLVTALLLSAIFRSFILPPPVSLQHWITCPKPLPPTAIYYSTPHPSFLEMLAPGPRPCVQRCHHNSQWL